MEKIGVELVRTDDNRVPWSKHTKLKFPRFKGEDFDNWLLRAEYLFKVDGISRENWVKITALHLEGKAIQ